MSKWRVTLLGSAAVVGFAVAAWPQTAVHLWQSFNTMVVASAFAQSAPEDDDDDNDNDNDDEGGDDVGGDDLGNDGIGDDGGGDDLGSDGIGDDDGGGGDDDGPGGDDAGAGGDDDGAGGDDDGAGNDDRVGGGDGGTRSARRTGVDDDAPGGSGVRGVSVSEANIRDGDRDRSRPSALPAGVDLDSEGRWVRAGEILALEADASSLNAARAKGFVVVERIALSTLGPSVVRLAAPRGKPLRVALEDLRNDDPDTAYDFNHIYFNTQSVPPRGRGGPAQSPTSPTSRTGPPPSITSSAGVLGLIDSALTPNHPSLRGGSIQQRDFVRAGGLRPDVHGTAVASLMVGEDRPNFVGAAPRARLLAASVVGADSNGESASADAIVRGIDWIIGAGAPVINISLAGPPNALLEDAVRRAISRGAIIVAAVGNDGPAAPPLYPAAYNDVVGVTAVDINRNIYRRAGRGDHVDVAAPGVGVLAANRQGRYEAVAGTSFAAPYVAGMLAAEHKRLDVASARAALQSLYAHSRDVGERGRDPVYGAGVVSPTQGN